MDNQNNQSHEMNTKKKPRRKMGQLTKIAIVAAVAGLFGGAIAYGGISLAQNGISFGGSSVPAGSNKNGGTKVHSNKDTGTSQSTKAFKQVKGAVVSVINMQKQSSDNGLAGLFGAQGQGQNGTDGGNQNSQSGLQKASEGSGVVYKKDGDTAYVVTNNHVVAGSNKLQVIMSDGKKLDANIVGTDETTDLAVLKINSSDVKTIVNFGNSDDIQAGQNVLAIGSPLGTQYATSVTEGIISATKRTVPTTSEQGKSTGSASVIQTDAAINPGNSGGPLINMAGQVIGINSMKLASDPSGTSVEGIGFSIPSNEVVKIINQLVANGKITRPALGISLVNLDNISADQQKSILKLPTSVKSGIVVIDTPDSSPVADAGIKKFDVITKFDGKNIKNQSDLRTQLFKHKVGDTVSVSYYREGKVHKADIKLTQTQSDLSSSSSSSNN